MKLLTAPQIREADQYTIKNEPIASIDLMERAAQKCSNWLINHFYTHKNFAIFTGPGNNGGDGLAIARQLAGEGFHCELFRVNFTDKLSADASENLQRLKDQNMVTVFEINSEKEIPEINKPCVIIDAIFGSGLSRPVEGLAKSVVQFINKQESEVVSIDIPSGLFSEDNSKNDYSAIVKANYTLTFELPKISFFNAEDNPFTGRAVVLDIGLDKGFINSCLSNHYLIGNELIHKKIKTREIFSHKGNYGHALLISGSSGKMGAALLSARACLKTGCGLISVHVPRDGANILQTAFPEAMVSIDAAKKHISGFPGVKNFSAVGIGPGLGTNNKTVGAFTNFLKKNKLPMVIDADGLNILANNKRLLKQLPENAIITPHPKEFGRLFGQFPVSSEKIEFIKKCSKQYNVIIVFKEAFTKVVFPNGNTFINQSGNPGMATAGSGDVLTGMILSLLAQGYGAEDAAVVAVYLHGLAGDIHAGEFSEESLIASDIINNIGIAFNKIKGEND